MSFAENIIEAIRTDPAIVAIVDDRIYQSVAPARAAYPYLIWEQTSGAPYHTMEGAQALTEAVWKFSGYDAKGTVLEQLRDALADRLDGAKEQINDTDLQRAAIVNERREFIAGADDDQAGAHRYEIDIEFHYA